MKERPKALLWSIIQFIVFSLFSILLLLLLFHLAIFGLPVLAFIWTFWVFNVFWFITKVRVKRIHVLIFALLSFFYTYFCISMWIVINMLDEKIPNIIFTINIIVVLPISMVAVLFIIKRFKEYFPKLKKNIGDDVNKIKDKMSTK